MVPRRSSATDSPSTPAQLEKAVNKRFGADTVMRGSDPRLQIQRIPTGVLSVDLHTRGGFPRNRHNELFGSANVGKTYLSYRSMAMAQELGMRPIFFDVEKTFDPTFASAAGVDVDDLKYVPQNKHGNQLIDVMETYLRSGMYDILVLDSIAALLPKGELEKDMEAGSYGTEQAKMMSAALRRLTTANSAKAANGGAVLIYINQTRDSIGSVFAAAQRTSGGRAMGFYAGMRLELIRAEAIKRKRLVTDPKTYDEVARDVTVGHRVIVRIEKNKTGGAHTGSSTTFVFNYAKKGIDELEDLIFCGRELGWIHKKGDHFWLDDYEDQRKHGRTRFKKWLRDNPDIAEQLADEIRNVEFPEDDDEEEE